MKKKTTVTHLTLYFLALPFLSIGFLTFPYVLCYQKDEKLQVVLFTFLTYLSFLLSFFLPVVHGIVWNKGAEIDCGSKITTVTLFRANFPWLDIRRMHVHLIDPTCRGYLNSTHVSFRFQTGGCGSKHIKSSSRDVIFSNTVFIVNKPYFQERKHKSILEINFYCKYSHTGGGNKKIKGFL